MKGGSNKVSAGGKPQRVQGKDRSAPQTSSEDKIRALSRSMETYKMLHAIANVDTLNNDLDSIFEKTMYILNKPDIFNIEKAGLSLIDETSKTAIIRAVKPVQNSVFTEGFRIPLYGSSLGFAVKSKSPIIKPLISRQTTFEESYLINVGIKSYVVIPIFIDGRPIATLNLSSSKENAFTSDERQFFTLLSKQLSSLAKDITELKTIKSDFEVIKKENIYLQDEITREHSYFELVGRNSRLLDAIEFGRMKAHDDDPVLVYGEEGTGKESLARLIHGLSPRRARAFVKFDCRSTSPNLIRFELFGRFLEPSSTRGKMEVAKRSTLYIESAELIPLDVQKAFIEEISKKEIRLIFSTTVDPEILLSKNYLLRELYDSLRNGIVRMPPLREMKEDIEELARHFLHKFARKYSKKVEGIEENVIRHFMSYNWPGNIGELSSVLAQAALTSSDKVISLDDIKLDASKLTVEGYDLSYDSIKERIKDFERKIFRDILERTNGRIYGEKGAAKLLRISPTTLQSRLKVLGLL